MALTEHGERRLGVVIIGQDGWTPVLLLPQKILNTRSIALPTFTRGINGMLSQANTPAVQRSDVPMDRLRLSRMTLAVMSMKQWEIETMA